MKKNDADIEFVIDGKRKIIVVSKSWFEINWLAFIFNLSQIFI